MKKILWWLPVAVVVTGMAGLVYWTGQQILRQEANDPQIQMAEDAARALSEGRAPSLLLQESQTPIETSLASYLVTYDQSGRPVAGSGMLDGQLPQLPTGVFDRVRNYGETRITWQPRPGVRSAIVVARFGGTNPGFVMAGRSLREVEMREDKLLLQVFLAWAATMGASLVVILGLAWFLRQTRGSSRL